MKASTRSWSAQEKVLKDRYISRFLIKNFWNFIELCKVRWTFEEFMTKTGGRGPQK